MRKVFQFITLTAVMALISGLLVTPASADDPYDERDKNQREQEKNEAALEETDADLKKAHDKLEETKGDISDKEDELDEAEDVLAEAERRDAELGDKLAIAEEQEDSILDEISDDDEEFDEAKSSLAAMAREAYRGDSPPQASMSMALGASSPEEFVDRLAVVDTAMRAQTTAVSTIQESSAKNVNRQVRLESIRDEISDLKKEAEENVEIANEARDSIAAAKDELEELAEKQEADADDLEKLKKKQKKKDAKLKAEREDIDAEIQELVRKQEEERKKAAEAAKKQNSGGSSKPSTGSGGGGSSGGSGGSGGGGGGGSSGSFGWPTDHRVVTSPYGWRFHPIWQEQRLHSGTDIRARCGEPIYAVASGTARAASMGGFGNQVLVDHGVINGKSYVTTSNHMQRFAVSTGQKVKKGQVLGYSGTTGTSTACHLHLEMHVNGTLVNPMSVL